MAAPLSFRRFPVANATITRATFSGGIMSSSLTPAVRAIGVSTPPDDLLCLLPGCGVRVATYRE